MKYCSAHPEIFDNQTMYQLRIFEEKICRFCQKRMLGGKTLQKLLNCRSCFMKGSEGGYVGGSKKSSCHTYSDRAPSGSRYSMRNLSKSWTIQLQLRLEEDEMEADGCSCPIGQPKMPRSTCKSSSEYKNL